MYTVQKFILNGGSGKILWAVLTDLKLDNSFSPFWSQPLNEYQMLHYLVKLFDMVETVP